MLSVTPQKTHLTQARLEKALDQARLYATKSRADSTWRAYKSDWRIFEAWCDSVALPPLPAEAETLAMFVAHEGSEGRSPSTITRRLAAIRLVHLGAGLPTAHDALLVSEVLRGVRRNWAKPPVKKAPAINTEIKSMADCMELGTARGLRDRAILLFGFAGAFRRSELVGLNVEDIGRQDEGMTVTIRKSKTDQEAEGHTIAVPSSPESEYCPVQAVEDWLTVAEIHSGPIFRRLFRGDRIGPARLSSQSVALLVKEYAYKAGLDFQNYSGHSLRRGFLTSAAKQKSSVFKMADQSRHKSLEMVREYVSQEALFEEHAGRSLL